jgi:4-hydroxybenzoate polyprenyltransferase
MRLPNVFSALSNIIAAYLVVHANMEPPWTAVGPLFLLLAASACLYCAGLVFNDYFDLDEDRRERPFRPLPSGQVSRRAAVLLGAALMVSGVVFAAMVSRSSLVISLSLCGVILLYDAVVKESWPGAAMMGACRYLNWLLGLSIADIQWVHMLVPLPVFLYVGSLTLLSHEETRGTNRSAPMWSILGITLSAALITAYTLLGVLSNSAVIIPLIAAYGYVIKLLLAVRKDYAPATIQAAITTLVIGIIPLDAILVMATGQVAAGALILFLVIPSRIIARYLYVT